jgi:acyl carrier protein
MEYEKEILKTYIFNDLASDKNIKDWEDDQSLLEGGVIDSLAILKLLSFIEEKFSIILSDDDFVPENFETINCLCGLIEKRSIEQGISQRQNIKGG